MNSFGQRFGAHSLQAETRVAMMLIAVWLSGAAILSTLPLGNAPQDQSLAFSRPGDARLPAQLAAEQQEVVHQTEDLNTLLADNHFLAAMATSDALSLAWSRLTHPYASLPVFNSSGDFLGNVCRVDMSAGGLAELHVIGSTGAYAMRMPTTNLRVEHQHIALLSPEPQMHASRDGVACG